jgi:hypothetical protein
MEEVVSSNLTRSTIPFNKLVDFAIPAKSPGIHRPCTRSTALCRRPDSNSMYFIVVSGRVWPACAIASKTFTASAMAG